MQVEAHFTDDASVAEERAGAFLRTDPLRHNVMCTLVEARAAAGTPIRFWWATVDGEVRGAIFQSPATFPALVSTLDERVVRALATAVAESSDPPVSAVEGLAADAARFAGEYATVTRRPGHPVEGQRIYEIDEVTAPTGVPGAARTAIEDDAGLVAVWLDGFGRDTGLDSRGPSDAEVRAAYFAASGRLHLWEVDGAPLACAYAQPPAAGVVRVGFVYTPPEHRRAGYASALVAEVSSDVLAGGERCMLYTQLSNPTSNAIYQRLGYRPIGELVRYSFD